MSRVTRFKHVLKEMMDDDYELPKETQHIVRIVGSRGNNLHEVESADEKVDNYLASMPLKFRKNIWVKRGDYVLVEPIEEGDKVKAEICKILSPEHVKEYTKAGVWPTRFTNKRKHEEDEYEDDTDGSDEDEFMVRNPNRPQAQSLEDEDTDESDEEDETK